MSNFFTPQQFASLAHTPLALADSTLNPWLIVWIALLSLALIVLGGWVYRLKVTPAAVPSADELRGRLAQAVTMWAMLAIVVLSVAIIAISGYRAAATGTVESSRDFVETAKYIFAAVVPVVAGWVGTVMAFYFGKENFRAATESVSQIAKQLTSQDKLGQTKVDGIGKTIDEVDPLKLEQGKDNTSVTLDKLEGKAMAKAPPFERLPVISDTGAPLMVVHRSVLNDFLLKKKNLDATKKASDFTLADLVVDYPWLAGKSFAAVAPTASAADAKAAMEKITGCSDVMVTLDGSRESIATRWITNVDLLKAAQV